MRPKVLIHLPGPDVYSYLMVNRLAPGIIMEAFLFSTLAVALAEVGDKTQLLSLLLVAKFRKPWTICCAILVATLINHGASALFGDWLSNLLSGNWAILLLAIGFFAMAAWILIPDEEEDVGQQYARWGAFGASFVLFFLAEIGDKTQIATVMLAIKYEAIVAVTLGTTLGMMLANVPVVFAGQWLLERLNFTVFRRIAAGVFVLMGVSLLVSLIL
ncbi:TMEM165/GDT1 family protein [Nitrincola alkalisediminis]